MPRKLDSKSTKFKRLVTVVAAKLTSHLSVWCNHVLNRLNELKNSGTLAQKIGRQTLIDIPC